MTNTADQKASARRISWLAIGVAVLSLVMLSVAQLRAGRVPWTSWALPILIITNVAVGMTSAATRYPRAIRAYYALSVLLALVILVSIIRR